VTPLAGAVLQILESEREYPPLSVEKITFCLKVTGAAGHDLTVADVEAALAELLSVGQTERIWRKGLPCYRVMPTSEATANQ